MPYIHMSLSERINKSQELQIKNDFGKAITLIPEKSEASLMLSIDSDCNMYFKGTDDPCAILEVRMMGNASRNEYTNFVSVATSIINNICGIPRERIYVSFFSTTTWGCNNFMFDK